MISTVQGVEYAHGPIVDKCKDADLAAHDKHCSRIAKGGVVCKAYLYPDKAWRLGNCPLATHIIEVIDDSKTPKKRVGQQKQQKH